MSSDGTDGNDADDARAVHVAPAPVPVDVGVVAALAIEVGFLLDRLARVRTYRGPHHSVVEGECGGKLVAVIVAGMGRAAARLATGRLLDGHRPRWVVSAGFAGALDPALKRGDLVMANEVLDLEGARYTIDVAVPPQDSSLRVRTGRLLTVDRIVALAAEKAELRRRFGADLVDMETAGVAALCSTRGVRLLSVRVVSDDAEGDLPPEVASLLTHSGSYRVGAALRAIWRRPSSLKDFWALHEHAHEAADRLATFTASAIERLP